MALKVCNTCGSRSYEDECPECLQAGRGSVRDFHYAFEDEQSPADVNENGVPDDEEKSDGTRDTGGDEEDLTEMSLVHLREVARKRDLPTSGTKHELLARLMGDGQG